MPLWSHSRIQAFQQCPRRYAYRYLEKPDVTRSESIEAFLGSRVHDTLEQLYRDVRMTKVVTEVELLDEYEKNWQKHYHDGIRIVRRRYTPEHYFAVGRRCLQDYYRRYQPFGQGRTLGLEERIVIDLDLQGDYRLQGYIDRITQVADGHYEIHDYKTSNSLPAQEHFDADRQLALYQIGIERRFGDARRVDLVWHYLQFDREMRSSREARELSQLRFDTIGVIQAIEEETRKNEFPTHESALCDWCEFMSVCPAKKHLFSLQDASPQVFREDDGVKLVDAWTRALEKRRDATREAELEMERLKEAITRFAQENQLEVIVGTDYKLRVKLRSGLKVPVRGEDPAAFEALVERLKSLGQYSAVSTLDRHAVLRLLEEGLLSDEERSQLEERLVPDSGVRITAARLSERERLVDL
jgi:putative RecB family exonuclease